MKITIKTDEEISSLREGGKRLAKISQSLIEAVKPGVSTGELDELAESLMMQEGGFPSFKNYTAGGDNPYPASICASINDKVVHAIPSKNSFLKEGDIIALDIGMWWPKENSSSNKRALCTDMAITVGVGKISEEAAHLISITEKSLEIAISMVREGVHIGDIGFAVSDFLKKEKIGLIKMFAGHGVGYEVHEDPLIPNFGKMGHGPKLKKNMVIALEPITTLGNGNVVQELDGWTYKTTDGSLAAHFEHTLIVGENGGEIITQI